MILYQCVSCEICSNKDEHTASLKTQVYHDTIHIQPLRFNYHCVVTGPQTSVVLSRTELRSFLQYLGECMVGIKVVARTQTSFPWEGQSSPASQDKGVLLVEQAWQTELKVLSHREQSGYRAVTRSSSALCFVCLLLYLPLLSIFFSHCYCCKLPLFQPVCLQSSPISYSMSGRGKRWREGQSAQHLILESWLGH